jgi:hypothetical protein
MRIKRALTIMAMVVLGSFLAVPVANAGTTCDPGEVCFFWDNNFNGIVYDVVPPSGGVINITSGWNDETSSWKNRSSYGARWYTNANGGGTCRSMPANTQKATLTGSGENDSLSSFATNGTC